MDPSIIYILILMLVSLFIFCVGLVALYLRLMKRYDELKHGKEANIDPETLLSQARLRSQQILEEAHVKAAQVLTRSQDFVKDESGVIAKELQKLHQTYAKTYSDAIESSKSSAEKMIQNIPQDVKVSLITAIDSFRVSLMHEVNKAQTQASAAIKEAYEKAAEEVNKYKEQRMSQVDKSILTIVKDVSEKVLSKSISIEEHEKLVQKSLEEAKKQRIFYDRQALRHARPRLGRPVGAGAGGRLAAGGVRAARRALRRSWSAG